MASDKDKLRASVGDAPPADASSEPPEKAPTFDDAAVERLMHALSMTRDDELSCAEVYAFLDEYAELSVENEAAAAALMPLMEMHLEMCPDCHEYFDALCHTLDAQDNASTTET
ncbi:MAG: hypothetical protein R3C44_01365 [Chloroflexota bacterium]